MKIPKQTQYKNIGCFNFYEIIEIRNSVTQKQEHMQNLWENVKCIYNCYKIFFFFCLRKKMFI